MDLQHTDTTVLVLARNGATAKSCPAPLAHMLLSGETAPELQEFLMTLRGQNRWLQCPCGRVLHPVKAPRVFLRLNDGHEAPPPGLGCGLCERAPAGLNDGGRSGIRKPGGVNGLILDVPALAGDDGMRVEHHGPSGQHALYASQRSRLRKLMEDAGWDGLSKHLRPEEVCRQLRLSLRREVITIRGGGDLPLSELVWLPDEPLAPASYAWKVAADWQSERVLSEMWLVGFVDREDIQVRGSAVRMTLRDAAHRRWSMRVERDQVAWTVSTPPYVCFAVGRATLAGTEWTPERVVLEGIASMACPVPVDSGDERRAVRVLQSLGRFRKVLFPSRGVWPDFLLADRRIILEVAGVRRAGYLAQKERTHEAMRRMYPGWDLVVWKTYLGEDEAALLRHLAKAS